jgi:hypothetical protein
MQLTETHEQCVCTSCQQVIAREGVNRVIDRESGIRTVTAYCEFCNLLVEETSRLCGGVWIVTDAAAIVADSSKREQFLKRLAQLRGDSRLDARAAAVPDDPIAEDDAIEQCSRKLSHLLERRRRRERFGIIADAPENEAMPA